MALIPAQGASARQITVTTSSGNKTTTVTITEPGKYKLGELFKEADTVAVVKVVSGDTENYERTVYKAQVVKSFKGAKAGEVVYFGPYIGTRLGWEYILFLRNVSKPMSPKRISSAGYGTIPYALESNQGYGSMESSYVCAFDGKEIAQHCDYGVRVYTDYVILPKSTRTFPPVGEDAPFGCRWVRKTVFISLLDKLAGARK